MGINTDDLPPSVRRVQQIMAKKIEKDNMERVRKAQVVRSRNFRTAGIITTGIFGICKCSSNVLYSY